MSLNRSRNAVLAAFLATVLAAAGCTGTEVLVPAREDLNIQVNLVNNTETRFESAYFEIRQIALRPVDPDADSSLAADALGALLRTMNISYAQEGPVTATTSVSAGTYRVTAVSVGSISFIDDDGPVSEDSCEDYITDWGQPNDLALFTDFGGEVFVTVEHGAENLLEFTVDGAALEAAFLDSWLCAQTFLCSPITEPWCLKIFLMDDFTDQSADFLEFPSQ